MNPLTQAVFEDIYLAKIKPDYLTLCLHFVWASQWILCQPFHFSMTDNWMCYSTFHPFRWIYALFITTPSGCVLPSGKRSALSDKRIACVIWAVAWFGLPRDSLIAILGFLFSKFKTLFHVGPRTTYSRRVRAGKAANSRRVYNCEWFTYRVPCCCCKNVYLALHQITLFVRSRQLAGVLYGALPRNVCLLTWEALYKLI